MSLEKMTCGVNYTTNLLRDNVNGLIDEVSKNGVALSTQAQGAGRGYPTLEKLNSNPLFVASDQSASSILWPWMVDMRQDGGDGVALFWSTDHGSHAASGTFMATADSPTGEWTYHGMIFRDDVTGGEQHETPSVVWDEVNNRWLQYYQLKFVPGYTNQLTLVATAPTILDSEGNPSEWTVIGVAATEEHIDNAGDGHSGYFKPFRYEGGWYAYSLYGGTDAARCAFWTSQDNGLTYQNSPQILQASQNIIKHIDGFDPSTWRVSFNNGAIIEFENKIWSISPVGGSASGGSEIPKQKICAISASLDGVTMGRAIDITPQPQSWEDTQLSVDEIGNAIMWEGVLFVTYRQGGGSGGFGLMEVK